MIERRLDELDASLALGVGDRGALAQVQSTDQGGEGHALSDQGGDDYREAEIDDVVAASERMAALGGGRHRQEGGQGDRPTHARPPEDQPLAPPAVVSPARRAGFDRISQPNAHIHTNRTTITVAATASPVRARRPSGPRA